MRMKKAAYVLLVLLFGLVLLFSACLRKAKTPKDVFAGHSGNYSTTAQISYKDLKAEAKISQETPASCSVVFVSPKSLQDMAFTFQSDRVDLSYKDLSFCFDSDSLPAAAIANLTVSSMNRAMRGDGLEMTRINGDLEITGMTENGEFSLRVDEATGCPTKLFIPAEEFEIAFVNFTFLD